MLRKILAAVGVTALLVLGGSGAAMADGYPVEVGCTVSPATVAVGVSTTITCTGLTPGVATFSIVGPNGTTTVEVTVPESGDVSTVFSPTAAGDYTVTVTDSEGNTTTAAVTVTAAAGGGTGGLPSTGGTVPAGAIWLGVGAIGLGGIAIAAAVARRRAHVDR